MKKYSEKQYQSFAIKAVVLLLIITFSIFLVNFIIDPFNMNGIVDFNLKKKIISHKVDDRLYKMLEYPKNPATNILLGDSRIAKLNINEINKYDKNKYYNFAYRGASLDEVWDTFWYADARCKLDSVYIGINFSAWSKNHRNSGTREAVTLIKTPFAYYISSYITKLSAYTILYSWFDINMTYKPSIAKDVFWQSTLDLARTMYGHYAYPDDAVAKLEKIKKYCDTNGIKLIFIIFPTHVDLQNKVQEHGLTREYVKYKQTLAKITTTIDYDYENEWTKNKDLFPDPWHYNDEVMHNIIKEVWTNNLVVGRTL